jgi:hypothetical protein
MGCGEAAAIAAGPDISLDQDKAYALASATKRGASILSVLCNVTRLDPIYPAECRP